ncbi:MAG: hypothetical protein ACYSW8_20640 [Planctomycetota bacterium]
MTKQSAAMAAQQDSNVINIIDGKIAAGTAITAFSAIQEATDWIDTANEVTGLALTIIGVVVGLATLCYTVERALKVRAERKDK